MTNKALFRLRLLIDESRELLLLRNVGLLKSYFGLGLLAIQ